MSLEHLKKNELDPDRLDGISGGWDVHKQFDGDRSKYSDYTVAYSREPGTVGEHYLFVHRNNSDIWVFGRLYNTYDHWWAGRVYDVVFEDSRGMEEADGGTGVNAGGTREIMAGSFIVYGNT